MNNDLLFVQAESALVDGSADTCIPLLTLLAENIRRQGIFSENEELDDVNTHDLKFLLGDAMLGTALIRHSKPANREAGVSQGKARLERFLQRSRQLGLIEWQEDETEKQYEERVAAGRAYKGPSREVKIERFKTQKALKASIEAARAQGSDERQLWLDKVRLACVEAMDEVDQAKKELEVLGFARLADPRVLEDARAAKLAPPSEPGIAVTRIAGPGFEMQKETFKDGVFRPFHRPPTMTLDEFAELEMAKLKQEQERQKLAPPPIKSLDELAEMGLEDDVAQVDLATAKARAWDDWKDDHPKGAGVTKRY